MRANPIVNTSGRGARGGFKWGNWRRAVAIAVLVALGVGPGGARGAGTISVTFDESQLVNNDPILTFYDGGTTYLGIGGGPDLGVEFTLNARVFTQTSGLTGAFTPPGIMELYSDTAREGEGISATMDVEGGFSSGIVFSYAAIDAAGMMQVYSGLDGTGTLLADGNLPVTSPVTGPGVFVVDSVDFSGVAQSVVFSGGNKQLAFDDLLMGVPEPPAWGMLTIGIVLGRAVHGWQRTRRARPRRTAR